MISFLKQVAFIYLRFFARVFIRINKPIIIGVTGSVGKTSTKDAIACALAARYRVAKSPKGYNSEIGIPLAVLGLRTGYSSPWRWVLNLLLAPILSVTKPRVDYLVLEMGVDRPGDMDKNISVARPSIGVFGAVGENPAHKEYFPNTEAVVHEKAKMLTALPSDGRAFVYADDRGLEALAANLHCNVTRFGFKAHADLRASAYMVLFTHDLNGATPTGIKCEVEGFSEHAEAIVHGVIGQHHVYPVLAALAVSHSCGIPLERAATVLESYEPPPGRMRILGGKHHTTILDDSYNASPIAVSAALASLHSLPATRRIACIGDMKELGNDSGILHEHVGEEVAKTADVAIFVGEFARAMARGAERGGMKDGVIHLCANSYEAAEHLLGMIRTGDVVLVKGSQSVRMERVSEAVLARKSDAKKLARQDWYWRRRK